MLSRLVASMAATLCMACSGAALRLCEKLIGDVPYFYCSIELDGCIYPGCAVLADYETMSTVQLRVYAVETHGAMKDGNPCDNAQSQCDMRLTFCVKYTDNPACVAHFDTGVIRNNTDKLTFDPPLDVQLDVPVPWTDKLVIRIAVLDEREAAGGNPNSQILDQFSLVMPSTLPFAVPTGLLNGTRHAAQTAQLTMSVEAGCASNYHGEECTTRCEREPVVVCYTNGDGEGDGVVGCRISTSKVVRPGCKLTCVDPNVTLACLPTRMTSRPPGTTESGNFTNLTAAGEESTEELLNMTELLLASSDEGKAKRWTYVVAFFVALLCILIIVLVVFERHIRKYWRYRARSYTVNKVTPAPVLWSDIDPEHPSKHHLV